MLRHGMRCRSRVLLDILARFDREVVTILTRPAIWEKLSTLSFHPDATAKKSHALIREDKRAGDQLVARLNILTVDCCEPLRRRQPNV
jgi:hypothetical protein